MNNKQIMYDCDKGYILSEKGPVGATCVGGLWRPTELPECSPALHPRLRYQRRRRRDTQKSAHQLPIQNYRKFQRKLGEMLRNNIIIDDPFPLEETIRFKRNSINQGKQRKMQKKSLNRKIHNKWNVIVPAIIRFKRGIQRKRIPYVEYQFARILRDEYPQQQQRNQYDEQQRAYNKYYEKIKQKHRNYISNLLRSPHRSNPSNNNRQFAFDTEINDENAQYPDDEIYKIPANDPFDEINAYSSMPIPLPNINNNRNIYAKKQMAENIINNTFVAHKNRVHMQSEMSNDFTHLMPLNTKKNVTDIKELLKLQIIRRRKRNELFDEDFSLNHNRNKRSLKDDGKLENDSDTPRKGRSREPCEVSSSYFYFCNNL